MALNPNTIKALFGKLAPYDDGVRAVISKSPSFDEDLYFSQFDPLPF